MPRFSLSYAMVSRLTALLVAVGALAASAPGQAPGGAGLAILVAIDAGRPLIAGPVNGLSQTADGTLVVSSDRLATFDGENWRPVPVPGVTHFYDSAPSLDGKRVWITANDRLGYLERSATGEWAFTSLRAALDADQVADFDEVRHVHATPEGAIFVARFQIIRWDGAHFHCWPLPSATRLYATSEGSELYIHQIGVGLLHFEADGPRLQIKDADLPGEPPLVACLSLPDGRRLAITHDGVFAGSGNRWARLEAATRLLKDRRAQHAETLSDGMIAVGTAYGGLILLRSDGQPLGAVDAPHGLRGVDVTALAADPKGRVWVGTSTGLARLDGPGWVSLFDRRAHLATRDVRAVVEQDGAVKAITSQGLYRFRPGDGFSPAQFDRQSPGLVPLHAGAIVDHRLWLAGPAGISLDRGPTPLPQPQEPNRVNFILPLRTLPRGFIYLDATAVKAWLPAPDGGWESRRLQAFSSAPQTAAEDAAGDLWISTDDGTIHHLRWTEPGRVLVPVRAFRRDPDLPGIGAPLKVAFSLGRIWAFGATGLLGYELSARRFAPQPELGGLAVAGTVECRGGAYWAVSAPASGSEGAQGILRFRLDPAHPGTPAFQPVVVPGLDQAGKIQRLDLTAEAGRDVLWVIGTNGVLRAEASSLPPADPVPALVLQSVQLDDGRPCSLETEQPRFPAGVRRIAVDLSPGIAATNDAGLLFQSRLEGEDRDWSALQPSASRELSGLPSGRYTLRFRAMDRFGRAGPVFDYPFVLLAPWYATPLAWTVWIAAGAGSLAATVRARLRLLEKRAARLNQLVEERTRELSLSHAAKSELLDTISHEIRDPINGIVGLISVLSESGLSPEQREQAEALRQCGASLNRLVTEVLNLSKLEYGLIKLDEKPFELAALARSICELQAASARRQGCALVVLTADEFVDGFWGDEAKIRTILNNFVGNGLKYAPGFPIEITLSHQESPDAGDGRCEVLIEVADQGPGVPEEEQELIFKKFVRGRRAQESNVAGVGMGLATCRVMARLLGGNVSIENGPERGAIFSLKLPLRRMGPPPPAAPDRAPRWSGPALIVEDQHYNRVVMVGLARQLGFEPLTAGNAEEALAALAHAAPAVIFIDVELPGVKGPELARRIRARPDGERPLIVATSADDRPQVMRECRQSGMDAFLLKPIDRAALAAAVAAAQAQRGPGEDPGALDWTAFDLYREAGEGDPAEARAAYRSALQAELAALEAAIGRRRAGRIAQAAHRVRSHAALIRATELVRRAAELEAAARAGQLSRLPEQWGAVAAAAAAVEAQVSEPTGSRGLRPSG